MKLFKTEKVGNITAIEVGRLHILKVEGLVSIGWLKGSRSKPMKMVPLWAGELNWGFAFGLICIGLSVTSMWFAIKFAINAWTQYNSY